MCFNISISISSQKLTLFKNNELITHYQISTAKNGPGQLMGSYKTPLGKHVIVEKSGENADKNTYFENRVAITNLNPSQLDRDWIIARILRLKGLENGINAGYNVDSYDRFIYIHGTHPAYSLNSPNSKGCVRMFADDIIELYDLTSIGTRVDIYE